MDSKNTLIFGQMNSNSGKIEGISRQIFAHPNGHVYEGQCGRDMMRNGYGRQIYCDGNYYEGYWKDGNKHGWGRKVYSTSGKVEEGNWIKGEF